VKSLLLTIILSCLSPQSFATTYTGKVISIADGDTIKILVDQTQHKIRLAEIDTPEKAQPYGQRAKQALSALAFGKIAEVEQKDIDRYGRIVGRVYINGIDVNAKMVRGGYAWVYRKYATDQSLYAMEDDARENKRGLWALPEAQRIPPWEWRNGTTVAAADKPKQKKKTTGQFKCGKKKCGQMRSCDEARFHLSQCGVKSLDRDKDGVPCESLCS